jgi:hypothetical protein
LLVEGLIHSFKTIPDGHRQAVSLRSRATLSTCTACS